MEDRELKEVCIVATRSVASVRKAIATRKLCAKFSNFPKFDQKDSVIEGKQERMKVDKNINCLF